MISYTKSPSRVVTKTRSADTDHSSLYMATTKIRAKSSPRVSSRNISTTLHNVFCRANITKPSAGGGSANKLLALPLPQVEFRVWSPINGG